MYIKRRNNGDSFDGVYYYKDPNHTILHREDGPAVEYANRDKIWYLHGALHRENGPAVELNGNKEWWINGKCHREDGPAVEFANGHKTWYLNGKQLTKEEFDMRNLHIVRNYEITYYYKDPEHTILHRKNGPAVEYPNGDKEWWVDGKCHREDGPAVEYINGYKEWWVNGRYHREDGPAIENANGRKDWYLNGKRHRKDGPAIEYANGNKYYYLNDKNLSRNEYIEQINKKSICPAKKRKIIEKCN